MYMHLDICARSYVYVFSHHTCMCTQHACNVYLHTYICTYACMSAPEHTCVCNRIIHVCVLASSYTYVTSSYTYVTSSDMLAYSHQHVDVCVLASYMNVHLNLHVCARFRRICACVREDNACTNACVQYVCACVHAMHTHK